MEAKAQPRLQLRSAKTELCPMPGWGPGTASSSKQSRATGLEQVTVLSSCSLPTPTARAVTEEKAPVGSRFSHIPEGKAPPGTGEPEKKQLECSFQRHKDVLRGAALTFCSGCRADVAGNRSGQARRGEGEGLSALPLPRPRGWIKTIYGLGLRPASGLPENCILGLSHCYQQKGSPQKGWSA